MTAKSHSAETEALSALSSGLDTLAAGDALKLLHRQQTVAAQAVESAYPSIALAADLMAKAIGAGGRLIYTAAGSSALMGLSDALELPGTFSIPNSQVVTLIAGGVDSLIDMAGGPEDDVNEASAGIKALKLTELDCLLCISASGTTPFALAAIDAARADSEAKVIGIACNAGTPVLEKADVAIHLPTPAEIVSGSTRMGAGTAQKITLNMMSTLMAIQLGHIHEGYMVNVRADNAKLRVRARNIVTSISGCDQPTAEDALERADNSVKVAVLLAAGASDVNAANKLLAGAGQKLRPALARINQGASPQPQT